MGANLISDKLRNQQHSIAFPSLSLSTGANFKYLLLLYFVQPQKSAISMRSFPKNNPMI